MEHDPPVISRELVLPELLLFRRVDKRVLFCLAFSNHPVCNDDIFELFFFPDIVVLPC